jgi:16S rRNA pseudouridine516 synthase
MMHAVQQEVIALHRTQIGSLKLDPSLAPGEFRALTKDEVIDLKTYKNA